MSVAEKLTKVAENVPKVYKAGQKSEYDRFWDAFQSYGNRPQYQYAFMEWNSDYIHPKYKVAPKSGHMAQMFCKSKVKKIEKEYFDFSNVPTAAYATNGLYYTFQFCSELEEIEVDLPGDFLNGTFHGCTKLHTIAKLSVKETTIFSANPFFECIALEEIRFEGVIGNILDLHWSTKLSAESYYSIITALSSSVSGQKFIVPPTAEATYNANPPQGDGIPQTWTELIGTKSNWTIAES